MLIGRIGSGKSYIAQRLTETIGAVRLSFGAAVYELSESVIGRKIDKSRPGDREILTAVGTTWGRKGEKIREDLQAGLPIHWLGRHGYADMWVDELERRVNALPADVPVVVDDTRFPNEFWRLNLSMQFMPTCVICSSGMRMKRLGLRGDRFLPRQDEHESELLPARISDVALEVNVMPVLWNDHPLTKPTGDWIFTFDEWIDALSSRKLYCDYELVRNTIDGVEDA
ncbi:hypothetical protein [Rhizobium sp.]|uniref:hypothetical protein n=1 Tax=Rhizobium sp. TaxID=391 RepID=UPI0028996416